MNRIVFFLLTFLMPIIFGWWLFLPMALLYVYLAKLPYEILVVSIILDSMYYFGEGVVSSHRLLIFSILLLAIALFLKDRVYWRKVI